MKGPLILKKEVLNALSHMESGKTTGPDITIEMISVLVEYEIDLVARLLNAKYDSEGIPSDVNLCLLQSQRNQKP